MAVLQDIIQERLMVLHLSLSNLKGTYLPRDSIDSMLSALTVRTRVVTFNKMFIYPMVRLVSFPQITETLSDLLICFQRPFRTNGI